VPEGRVVSYGQVSSYAGMPRLAREVGWILHRYGKIRSLPWWRVVNKNGEITIRGTIGADRQLQKCLLEKEGITVTDEFTVNIDTIRFFADEEFLQRHELPKDYISAVMQKFRL
jgi:methylated-DNA-protein-cysteine methyltransferase-like protein